MTPRPATQKYGLVSLVELRIFLFMQDLLAPEHDNLALREGPSGVYVEGVREEEVADIETCLKHLQIGDRNRC